jgi:uncharacterized membrane protein YhaH (DUF805 family)
LTSPSIPSILDDDAKQQILDEDNLRLLSIGYFIVAGLNAFASLLLFLYLLFFSFIFTQIAKSAGEVAFPSSIGWVIGIVGVLVVLLVVGFTVLQFLTAMRLRDRKSRTFCLVMAAITCLGIPYGTFLGVCTFLVLLRPTVQRSFEEARS